MASTVDRDLDVPVERAVGGRREQRDGADGRHRRDRRGVACRHGGRGSLAARNHSASAATGEQLGEPGGGAEVEPEVAQRQGDRYSATAVPTLAIASLRAPTPRDLAARTTSGQSR